MDISKETIWNARNVFNKLEDEKSKKIFIDKLLYSMTDDFKYILDIIKDFCCDIEDRIY